MAIVGHLLFVNRCSCVPEMAVSLVARTGLFKGVLSSTFRTNALLKPYASYPPQSVKKYEEIPGPNTYPILGILPDYFQGKYSLYDLPLVYEGYFKNYGPLVKEHVYLGKTLVHVFDPEDMSTIYSLDKTNHPYRVSHRALEKYRIRMSYRNGGLASSNGETWAELRRLLGDDLLKPHHSDAFEIVAQDLVNKIYKLIAFKPNRQLSLFPWLYYWALECIAVFSLGESFEVFRDNLDYTWYLQFIKCIRDSQEIALYTENLPEIMTYKAHKRLEDLQEFMYIFLMRPMSYPVFEAYKYEERVPPGIVVEGATICIKNSLAHALVQRGVDDRDVRTFVIDLFQGGIHPTAHVLAFAMYYLATHPEEQKKVRDAIKSKLVIKDGNKGGSMPVCQEVNNVLLETMRLNPPTIGTGRVLPEPLVLSNYTVPKGTNCILHHQIASKNKEYFENPDQFIPDRYNSPLKPEALVANSPFAMGKRACPGKDVALNELGITLTTILKHFELVYEYEEVGLWNRLINEPDKEMIMTFKPSPLR